ncbi:hypothetical protein ABH931_003691 [Streptacidiphilus sp. MAP12-33]|uniref:hypothetical protein n=1 Tax=Streptacidiphilus sp. MAP12-33 TaxID=3156266 RepID=UPI0035138E4B
MQGPGPQLDIVTDIPDVAGIGWEALERLPLSALTESARRILRDAEGGSAPLVSFQSGLDD